MATKVEVGFKEADNLIGDDIGHPGLVHRTEKRLTHHNGAVFNGDLGTHSGCFDLKLILSCALNDPCVHAADESQSQQSALKVCVGKGDSPLVGPQDGLGLTFPL